MEDGIRTPKMDDPVTFGLRKGPTLAGRVPRGFGRDEDGSLLVFGLVLFVLMSMMGGLAVDLIRYEQRRTDLQQTLDRSVLAAASLSQKLNPIDVVNDYFDKANLSDYIESVSAPSGLNYRIVQAQAASPVAPYFMQMIGINGMSAKAVSTAEQRISNVEVSLVLDVSGSMRGSRINNLRPAAVEFVDSVLATSDPGRVTLSIVPYNATVNVGRDLMKQFNVTENHTTSFCIELPDSVFSSVALSKTLKMTHNAHFDPYYGYNTYGANNMLFHCTPNSANEVVALSDDKTKLHSAINNMEVDGNTSIDVGVKWGALLLDESSQPIVQGLITAGKVKSIYSGRPLTRATHDVMKVLVVMTDGQNTTEYKIRDPYNTGMSPIWKRNSNGDLSIYHEGRGEAGKKKKDPRKDFYWLDDRDWNEEPDGGTSGSTQLTWQQVWANYTVDYIAYQLYSRPLGGSYSNYYYDFVDYVWSNKNARLQSICSAAKAAGIVVYGIGFEAPSDGRSQLRACANSDAHYFDASGLEISTAFRAIANNISQLRLTQ
jgi:Flp pilus assembly protein TadG